MDKYPDGPSIVEMTEKAVEMLRKGDNGFFLMVEGGRVDHAHHDVQAVRALSETVALDRVRIDFDLQSTVQCTLLSLWSEKS